MADPGALWTFTALSLAIIVVPGPSVLFVVGRALAHGRRTALLSVLGNAGGFLVQVLLVSVGLGALVARSVAVFTAVKLLGAGYLAWLGFQAIRQRRARATVVATGADRATVPAPSGERPVGTALREGFVVGVANPKVVVFLAAFLPQFTVADGVPVPVQMAVLGGAFAVLAVVCDGAYGIAAGAARDWLARDARRLERVTAAGGLAMVGLGLHLALTGRPD